MHKPEERPLLIAIAIAAALALFFLLNGCCPSRNAKGAYWKPWDVPHRMFAGKSDARAHQLDCPTIKP